MSPLLFAMFVEYMELYLQTDVDCGLPTDDIISILLLFADDMVITGKTPTEIQNYLDYLFTYCNHWGLHVITAKTKIMVFHKRGGLLPCERCYCNSQIIEAVMDSNYLGVVFNYTGSFNLNQEY